MINYLTQEEYENQLMIHQILDIESEILINNEENQQPNLGRKYELRSRQVPITTLRKQNVGRKAINQPVVPVIEPVFVPNQPQPRKPVIESREVPTSSFNFESELRLIWYKDRFYNWDNKLIYCFSSHILLPKSCYRNLSGMQLQFSSQIKLLIFFIIDQNFTFNI